MSYNNSDDLYIFTNQMFDQPAINDAGIVFLDMNIFDDMNDVQDDAIILWFYDYDTHQVVNICAHVFEKGGRGLDEDWNVVNM